MFARLARTSIPTRGLRFFSAAKDAKTPKKGPVFSADFAALDPTVSDKHFLETSKKLRQQPPDLADLEAALKKTSLTNEEKEALAVKRSFVKRVVDDLFAEGKKGGASELNKINANIVAWEEFCKSAPEAAATILHPLVAKTKRASMINDVAAHLSFSKAFTSTLLKLAEEEKLSYFPKISAAFATAASTFNKEVIVTVRSASPLSKENLTKISSSLKKHVKQGENITLKQEVDPRLLGGFVLISDKFFQDLSVATVLTKMEQHIAATSG